MQRSSSCEEPRHPLVSLGYFFFHTLFLLLYMVFDYKVKKNLVKVILKITRTDPTAGSPTVTLLRLLLPLDNVI